MSVCSIINKELAKMLMPSRAKQSNKGTFGKVLNFSGCKEYVGAAYLSSVSALRVGAGLVELAAPSCVKTSVAALSPDIVFSDIYSHSYIEAVPKNINFNQYSAVIVGCGLGNNRFTNKFLKNLIEQLKNFDVPVVYDADALNIISEEGLVNLGKKVIITPHPGEMARLMGSSVADVQAARNDFVRMAAQKYNAVTVLKGYNTLVASPDGKVFKDVVGTNVLAKAGMGDVLSGIIAGLLAQGLNCKQSAVLGVYLHSQAGLVGEKVRTQYGLLASELVDFIPDGIKSIIL